MNSIKEALAVANAAIALDARGSTSKSRTDVDMALLNLKLKIESHLENRK